MKNLFAKLTDQELLLFDAIKNGDIAAIEGSLKNDANINVFGDQYEVYKSISPLEYAVYCNADKKVITFLIDHGASIDEVNEERKRSMLEIVICFYKDNTLVDYLLEKGAQYPTVEHRHAFEGNIELLKYVKGNIDDIKTPSGCTLLHYAIASGKLDTVKWLLKQRGANVHEKDMFGLTALSGAATKGHLETVRWLLKKGGAKIDQQSRRGLTAFLCAAVKGQMEVVKWLLNKGGARIDEKDKEGNTALLCAAMNGRLEVAKWLLEHGASIQEKNEQGKTAGDLIPGKENKKDLSEFKI